MCHKTVTWTQLLILFFFYLSISRLRDLAQVVLSPSGDLLEENLLSHSTSEHHAHPVEQLLLAEEVLFRWQVLCVAQTFPPGNYGHLGENITHSETTSRK